MINTINRKLTYLIENFTNPADRPMGVARMKTKKWFAGKTASHDGDPLFQSFFRLIARSRAARQAQAGGSGRKPATDSGAEACWTAALYRGDSLPLFRLSILSAEDSPSAMRLEPCRRDPGPSRPGEL
jgi:hypothetical protein